jgi:chitinase
MTKPFSAAQAAANSKVKPLNNESILCGFYEAIKNRSADGYRNYGKVYEDVATENVDFAEIETELKNQGYNVEVSKSNHRKNIRISW